ncbi:MAG: DUF421 domain-containing protein [Firmicutes bacterium]|nr:DUF421 domain-containing protein [Bacillota bacterium]
MLTIVRLMGKRQIGEMQPFELVITIILAELAAIPMADNSIPIYYGIIPVLAVFLLHVALTKLGNRSIFMSRLISGNPMIVIDREGINIKNMNAMDMSYNDLIEKLRVAGHFDVSDIAYAIFETNGQLSILPKDKPPTLADMNELTSKQKPIDTPPPALPVVLISEGKINKSNLKLTLIDECKLKSILAYKQVDSIKDIYLLTLDNNGKVTLQTNTGEFKTFNINYFSDKW